MPRSEQKTLLEVLAGLSVAALLLGFAGMYLWQEIQVQREENMELANELARAEAQVSQISQFRTAALSVAEDRELLSSLFVTDDAVIHVLEQIERVGLGTGASVEITKVEKGTHAIDPESEPVAVVRIGIASEGSWSEVMDTVVRVESLPRAIVAQALHLETNPETSGRWRGEFELLIPQH